MLKPLIDLSNPFIAGDTAIPGALAVTGTTTLGGQLDLTGVQTDTSVGTVNDFALTAGVSRLVLNPASTLTISGIAGGVDGRILIIESITGAAGINLQSENVGSIAANRIAAMGNATMTIGSVGGQNVVLIYDGSNSRWRPLAVTTNTTTSSFTFSSAFYLSGSVAPTALAGGTTNDYAPANSGSSFAILQNVTSPSIVTGMSLGQSTGRFLFIRNTATAAANTLTLAHESGSSTAANRFTFLNGTPLVLGPGASVLLHYISSRWSPVNQMATSPMGSGSPDGVLTGAAGQLYTDTATLVVWQNTDGATAWDPINIPKKWGHWLETDLDDVVPASTASIGGSTAQVLAEAARPGIRQGTFGVAGTDGAAMGTNTARTVVLGGGVVRFRAAVRNAVLSDATNNLIVRVGSHGIITIADATTGVYFEYDFATNGDHKWRLCTANGGVRTKTDTGILNVASSTTFQTMSATVNAAGTSVTGSINGVAVATPVTTNIPTTTLPGYSWLAYKQLGGGNLTAAVDWMDFYVILSAAR